MSDANWSSVWGADLHPAVCEHCHSAYLVAPGGGAPLCPACYQDALDSVDEGAGNLAYTEPPELVVPFGLDEAQAAARIEAFARDIPFAPRALRADSLRGQLRRVYLPMWLVDTEARGVWQAEAGFFYEVVSHKDQYTRGSWQSQEVKERRTRWEPRIGRLERRYENVAAPALEQHATLERRIGGFRLDQAAAYQPDKVAGGLIRLPDRSPDDAWIDAQAGVQTAASNECRRAAKADDIREFRWTWQYKDRNWTQLLTPAYSAVYHDDEGAPRVVLVNGQSGQVWGEKRASMQRARQVALLAGGAAALFFVLSLIAFIIAAVYAPGSAALGVVGLFVAVGAAIGAIAPLIRVSRFNAAQAREDTRPA